MSDTLERIGVMEQRVSDIEGKIVLNIVFQPLISRRG